MQLKGEIVELMPNSFNSKSGVVNQKILLVRDVDDRCRGRNNIEFVLSRDQETQFRMDQANKYVGMPILLGVKEIRAGFGRLRIEGEILEFKNGATVVDGRH